MTKLSSLPLVALVGLGLAACGNSEPESQREQAADQLEQTGDRIEERADRIEDRVDDEESAFGTSGRDMNARRGQQDGVTVSLSGFQPTGTIYVALQDQSNFAGNDATYGTSIEPMGNSVDAVITGVNPGEYALAVFQDTNGNGQLDLGVNGVPTEPWYLSGDAGQDGAPQFGDASKRYEGRGDSESVDLSETM